MKLLLDENLSRRLVALLPADHAGSRHVSDLGLTKAPDREIWDFARREGFLILTKDSDFFDLAFAQGPPPKVVWLRLGNCSTKGLSDCLARNRKTLLAFASAASEACLELS